MGMYDDIKYECECPNCGNTITGFQSKNGPCELKVLEPSEVDNFYSSCSSCSCWIEFDVAKKNNTEFERRVAERLGDELIDEHTKTITLSEK